MRVPSDKALVVRAKDDGRPLRVLAYGSTFVNPLTETAELLDTSIQTVDQSFRDIDTTLDGKRVPVNLRAVMQVWYCHPDMLTIENADRLSRTPHPVLLGEIITAADARLRQACVEWTPEGLRSDSKAATEWVVRAVQCDLRPSGLSLRSLVVKEVTDGHHFFDTIDARKALAIKRDVLRKEGIDPGPEPPRLITPEELGAESVRVNAMWKTLEARRASGRPPGDTGPGAGSPG